MKNLRQNYGKIMTKDKLWKGINFVRSLSSNYKKWSCYKYYNATKKTLQSYYHKEIWNSCNKKNKKIAINKAAE